MMPPRSHQAVLTLACPDVPGVVHAVTGLLVEHAATIVESQQYGDPESRRFFMRVQFASADGSELDFEALHADFRALAGRLELTWRLVDVHTRRKVIIMVSRHGHCLNDLLFRNSVGELNLDVVCVVSNHRDLAGLADDYGVPFRHIPIRSETKPQAEAALMEVVHGTGAELVVLARYMQILSPGLCEQLEGRCINIHHSMLPSFKGAQPYHQAHARGVKVIGATAHYVTAGLDEGPIIAQAMEAVDHSMTAEDFESHGREVEARALARAVRWHTENRVALNGHRTVVLR